MTESSQSHVETAGTELAQLGLIGLAVMGENLVINMARHGLRVAVYNRTQAKVQCFINGRGASYGVKGAGSLQELASLLQRPRVIILMVRAGSAVDDMVGSLLPMLERGDIIVDGGNSHYMDSERRCSALESRGIHFVGLGVSGGEEGALNGPSMMPGGSAAAWPTLSSTLQMIAVAYGPAREPCCAWIGPGGSGHFVKMIHNGHEYAVCQAIAEAYHVMRPSVSNEAMAKQFAKWNRDTDLRSYLIKITAEILAKVEAPGRHTIDLILDRAGQKGTGKWTAVAALEAAAPVTTVTEAVFARGLSYAREDRIVGASKFGEMHPSTASPSIDAIPLMDQIRDALRATIIISFAQSFSLMHAVSSAHHWKIDFAAVARIWRKGCIIRSAYLPWISEAFARNPGLTNLLFEEPFDQRISEAAPGLRAVVLAATGAGIPTPVMGAALCYFDGIRTARGPSNLIQAQRDYFGAHTYERVDKPEDTWFHTNWTGKGGDTHANAYNV